MRILHVNKYIVPRGGSETYMFNVCRELESAGHKVGMWGMSEDCDTLFHPKMIDYSRLSLRGKLRQSLASVYSVRNRRLFSKFLDRFRPDIVHVHNFNYQLTPSILLEAYRRHIPIVYTAHDTQLVCPYHRFYNFRNDAICELCTGGKFYQCMITRCFNNSFLQSVIGMIESYVYHLTGVYQRTFSRIICPSKFLANKISQVHDHIEVLPNFSKDNGFSYEKQDYAVYVGRVSPEKGIVEVAKMFEDSSINLKVVGSGPSLDDVVDGRFVQKLGRMSGEPLQALIQNAKFLVLPTKCYENCPMTIIEAFSHATPVIGSNHSGIADMIKHNANGFLFDFNTSKSSSLLPDLYKKFDEPMAIRSRQAYTDYYSVGVHMDKLTQIYDEVICESS